jgi:adenine-specific DNA-methyltransferase
MQFNLYFKSNIVDVSDSNISKYKRNEIIKKIDLLYSQAKDEDTKNIFREIENQISNTKYGLIWENHQEDIDIQLKDKIPVFVENTNREIITDTSLPYNFIIEGDNLHSLYLLEKTHKHKIDVIYIDPPFNTGAKDWKYNNDYVVKEDSYRHSKWLSMMYRRLRVAKRLLKSDGSLVCAIDNNEQATLTLLLEDVFGEDYKIDCITVVHNPRGTQSDNFSYTHEYALFVYKKNQKIIIDREIDESEISWAPLRNWGGESSRYDAATCFYPIYVKNNQIIGFGKDITNEDMHPKQTEYDEKTDTYAVYPIDVEGIEHKWRYSRESVEKIFNLLRVKDIKNGNFDIELGKNFGSYKTVWTDKKYDANEYGTQLIGSIVPNNDFDFPKSLYTVYECIYSIIRDKPKAIVLDYFAGSGTTGHAVLLMNKLLGGSRSFILCTNNSIGEKKEKEFQKNVGSVDTHQDEWEKYEEQFGIARSITYPRIKNVIEGYVHKKDFKESLFRKEITVSTLKKFDKVSANIELIISNNKEKYDEIKTTIENNCIEIIGITKKNNKIEGLPGNLKYYKTDFIDKYSDSSDYLIEDALLSHCKEMIQLENGININNGKYVLLLSEIEANKFETEVSIESGVIAVFYASSILISNIMKNKSKKYGFTLTPIPDYYFAFELKEVGEI